MSLFYEHGEYPDDRSDGWERAVVSFAELLCSCWNLCGEHLAYNQGTQPLRHNLFHVRNRIRLQLFMSSTLLHAEDTKKLQSKIFLSY
ncbi:hypothetical protein AAFF_G00203690 [Aldrovandia affinis]|uniref:Uncharacterized protein n=1 Tax=Aldrovandia affinis TaxID=143900 RepID=A0AAD7SXZ4_9TELE|nr:hypothetical protein AAFF_G00203690 [Aldrovandia affinis]